MGPSYSDLSRPRICCVNSGRRDENFPTKFTVPMKRCTCVTSLGSGMSAIALILSGSARMPYELMTWPKKQISVKLPFSLKVSPASEFLQHLVQSVIVFCPVLFCDKNVICMTEDSIYAINQLKDPFLKMFWSQRNPPKKAS